MTKQQALVLSIVLDEMTHLSAEDIFLIAKEKMPSIAMGTVYRTLNILVKKNRIRRVEIAGYPDKFDSNIDPHDHLICTNCGDIQDIKITNLKNYLEEQVCVDISSFNLCINYVCPKCKNK
ncbi:MAG: transcriptional repressor [Longicatena sp.]